MAGDVLGARTHFALVCENYVVTASDVLVPITSFVRGSEAPVTTQPVVATGKVLRIQSVLISGSLAGTTIAATSVRLRVNMAGATDVTSPRVVVARFGNPGTGTQAVGGGLIPVVLTFGEGLELPAGASLQFSAVSSAASQHSIYASLYGFEYTP